MTALKIKREKEILKIIKQNFSDNKTTKLVESLKFSLMDQGIDKMGNGEYEKLFNIPKELGEFFGPDYPLEEWNILTSSYPLFPLLISNLSTNEKNTLYLAYIIDKAFSELTYSSICKNKRRKGLFFFECKKITYPFTILIEIKHPGVMNHNYLNLSNTF